MHNNTKLKCTTWYDIVVRSVSQPHPSDGAMSRATITTTDAATTFVAQLIAKRIIIASGPEYAILSPSDVYIVMEQHPSTEIICSEE